MSKKIKKKMSGRSKTCERCGSKFKCFAGTGKRCWCNDYVLSRETLKQMKTRYRGCLCPGCLAAFAKKDEMMKQTRDPAPRTAPEAPPFRKKGLVIVFTGGGKGKSTAAYGTILRSLGHGRRVAMVQFMKGKWKTGERKALERFSGLFDGFEFGEGFTWETKSFARDVRLARKAWRQSLRLIRDTVHPLVVLDEINYCLKYGFLDPLEVARALKGKPPFKHVLLTGDGAPQALIDAADLVSEMRCVKHPYEKGIPAQPGIEY
jgi:cob(I)alamin adenosyltransferase